MLAGFGGHLLSETFLERQLDRLAGSPSVDARDLADWMRRCRHLGPASSLRVLVEVASAPFFAVLGFDRLADVEFSAATAAATLTGVSPPVGLIVTFWGERLDPLWRQAIVEARKRRALWCCLFNGTHVRLIDAERVYSRRHVEFDLSAASAEPTAAAALAAIFSADAFRQSAAGAPPLRRLVDDSERHTADVSLSLKDGVLSASREILQAVAGRRIPASLDDAFEQALTIVYRIVFLLFAEARGLVPLWHPVYRESYSLEGLRREAEATADPSGLWDSLQAITRLAHAGCQAGDLRVTAFNGRLFAPARTPLAERHDLDDGAARRAILALSTRPSSDRASIERIGYRDLGVEQLGAVYETLLDYSPRTSPAPANRSGQRIVLEPGSGLRKATGTFYTPLPLAHYLVRQTLGPLVAGRSPEGVLAIRVLDPAMGSGAFLVAGCSFLADAYEAALVRSGGCLASDIGSADRVAIRRKVADRCLFGVDLNPMAVQLSRLSLWLATLSADKPLGFLDHHLQVGDSLIGAWLSLLGHGVSGRRHKARPDTPSLFGESPAAAALTAALPVRFDLSDVPSDTLEQVRHKERALAALNRRDSFLSRWKRIADLWCAHWVDPETQRSSFAALSDAILTGRSALPESAVSRLLDRAERTAAARRFFHWELEFPEVFFDRTGARLSSPGFDAVIGNPPWEMMRADAGTADRRDETRRHLDAAVRFVRDSGIYRAQSHGHANRYQLFVERCVTLTRQGGRLGLVLPWGLAADHGSASLRRLLFSECSVEGLVGFENRRGLFPIHRGVRFVLATAMRGGPTGRIGCRLGEHDPAVLEGSENGDPGDPSWFPVHVTPALLEKVSGPDLALPDVRTPLDVSIVERTASIFPPLGHADGWAVRFGRELNASDDRKHFVTAGRGLPVIEGKALTPFRAAVGTPRFRIASRTARQLLGARHERPRLAYRDVASSTNRVTLIAAVLPPGVVSTHTVFCLRTALPLRSQHYLCGLFNSLVLNYLTRLRVGTHVTTAIVEALPVPTRHAAGPHFSRIAALARVLVTHDDVAARVRLNACVARLYQMREEDLAHLLGTFPLIPPGERHAVMEEFRRNG